MNCSIDRCDNAAEGRGYCRRHYMRWWRYGDPLGSPPPRKSVAERILEKVRREPSGCWAWTAYIDVATGYGRFGKMWAHRASYETFVGPIADGLHIDHLCRNTVCVNPDHLEPVTNRVNVLRGMSPNAIAVRTNRCKRGHEFSPENTYIRPDTGGRRCRACHRLRKAAA